MEDTSIVMSLNLINRCREALRKLNRDVQFRALYIEEKSRRFKTLQSYLSTRVRPTARPPRPCGANFMSSVKKFSIGAVPIASLSFS